MKKIVTAFAMMALLMVSSLTVQAEDTNSRTADEKNPGYMERIINELEWRPAGKAYPDEYYVHTGYGIWLEDMDENFEAMIQDSVEAYNSCHELEIEAIVTKMNKMVGEVRFQSKNLYYIEHTPVYIGQRAYVREGKWTYWESSEGFGSGKSGTIRATEGEQISVIVTGVSYLNEEGDIISSSFKDCEEIKFAELRMLHIATEEGVDLGWIWPLCLAVEEN